MCRQNGRQLFLELRNLQLSQNDDNLLLYSAREQIEIVTEDDLWIDLHLHGSNDPLYAFIPAGVKCETSAFLCDLKDFTRSSLSILVTCNLIGWPNTLWFSSVLRHEVKFKFRFTAQSRGISPVWGHRRRQRWSWASAQCCSSLWRLLRTLCRVPLWICMQ